MGSEQALTLVSAAVYLAIALMAALRRGKNSPLALDLALMGVALFGYNLAELLSVITEQTLWDCLEDAAAALVAIPTLRLFFGFAGKKRKFRRLLQAAGIYFVAVAVIRLSALVQGAGPPPASDPTWGWLMLLGIVPSFTMAAVLLVRHTLSSRRIERARAQLLMGALVLGVGGVTTDLVAIVGGPLPRLSFFGLVGAALLISALVLRARFLDGITALSAGYAVVIAAIAVTAELAVLAWAGTTVALGVGTAMVMAALVVAMRPLVATLSEERARSEYHATLGRSSEQIAHQVKNPLAAIRGAAEILLEEKARGNPLEPHAHYLDTIVASCDRINARIEEMERIARVEPMIGDVDLAAMIEDLLEEPWAREHDALGLEARVDERARRCRADGDLLRQSLENLIRNAIEAMEEAGSRIEVISERFERQGGAVLRLTVSDDGPGMDARTREQALDAFFTSKAQGTGIGLFFAKRVAEAHGGHLELHSAPGKGTKVVIDLPIVDADSNDDGHSASK